MDLALLIQLLLQLYQSTGAGELIAKLLEQAQAGFDLQKRAAEMGMDPNLTAQNINQLTRAGWQSDLPAISQAVKSQVEPGLGMAGLSTSPALTQYFTAQAMGPYRMQERQLGEQEYFAGLGLPFGIRPPWPSQQFGFGGVA